VKVLKDTGYEEIMGTMTRYCSQTGGPVNSEVFGNATDSRWFIANHVDKEVRGLATMIFTHLLSAGRSDNTTA
jgi:hypothetical protein